MATKPPFKRYFFGFSTQNSSLTGIRTLYDVDLINVDLMTSFMTRVGERVMRPDWGCKLWDYLMEPWTATLSQDIINETNRICSLDSRLVIINCQVFPQQFGFQINMTLQYLPLLVIRTFTVTFNQSEDIYFGFADANTTNLIG